MTLEADLDLMEVVQTIPRNFTGADFSALTSEAYLLAAKEKIGQLENEIAWYRQSKGIEEDILPETYLKLQYQDENERRDA